MNMKKKPNQFDILTMIFFRSPEEMKVVLENILRMMKGEVCFNNLNEMQEHILEFASNYVKAVENRKMNAKEFGKAM